MIIDPSQEKANRGMAYILLVLNLIFLVCFFTFVNDFRLFSFTMLLLNIIFTFINIGFHTSGDKISEKCEEINRKNG